MAWPMPQDYNEAIQNPATCFNDVELRQGQAVINALGLPMPRSGNFADVYEFDCPTTRNKWAIKCFTREIAGLKDRYREISTYLQRLSLPFMVDFTYLDQGIRVRGQWFPILKMQWVEGLTLNDFVRKNVDKPQPLEVLSQLWVRLAAKLREAEMAHGDLQHGNVLLVPGSKATSLAVKLVDYDGMCVPTLTLLKSVEVGHPNFQHPQRARDGIYSVEIDRFPNLVIYTALKALKVGGKALWEKYDNGDNLLFKAADFEKSNRSPLFAELLRSPEPRVRALAQQMMDTLGKPLAATPLLEDLQGSVPAASQVQESGPAVRPASRPFDLGSVATPRPSRKRMAKRSTTPILVAAGAALLVVTAMLVGGVMLLSREAGTKPESLEPTVGHARPTEDWGKGTKQPSGPADKQPLEKKIASAPKSDDKKPIPPAQTTEQDPKVKPKPDPEPMPETKPAPEPNPDHIVNSIGMEMVPIKPGKFLMGTVAAGPPEGPQHEVELSRPFFLGVTEVTQGQYEKVIGKNPSFNKAGSDYPVEQVSWSEAVEYCRRLSALPEEGKAGRSYRLPTEAEWEYACRAGTKTSYYHGDDPKQLGDYAWFNESSQGKTHAVGQKKPNAWGLRDMEGNVWEWCQDGMDEKAYQGGIKKDPLTINGDRRLLRGGSCLFDSGYCRSALRRSDVSHRYNDIGFRVVAVASETRHALRFKGQDFVELAQTKGLLDFKKDLSIELDVRLGDNTDWYQTLASCQSYPGTTSPNRRGWCLQAFSDQEGHFDLRFVAFKPGVIPGVRGVRDPNVFGVIGKKTLERGRWYQIAISKSRTHVRIFLDGKAYASESCAGFRFTAPSDTGLRLGVSTTEEKWSTDSKGKKFKYPLGGRCDAEIRGFRASSTARYEKDYLPAPFVKDTSTLILLDFSKADEQLKDLSGSGHDGTRSGTEWVEVPQENIKKPN